MPELLHAGATSLDFVLVEERHATPPDLIRIAFYKDTNPRNILIITAGGLVIVDVDDLTLAPFGYDLAKLIVTLAMTHGRLPDTLIHRALDAYNTAAARLGPRLGHVDHEHLFRYAALHHILTAPYLGRGGYRYPWPTVQPTAWQGARQ